MGNNRKLQVAVRAALALATASAAIPAAEAQTATAANSEATTGALEEVVVTGSRIQSTNLVSISPVTTVTAEAIQQTGLTRVEDILNNLPQVFAGQGSNVSNGSDGTATVDLHDLGPQRTLVLVNGRRLGPGGGATANASDINQIPAQLIEKVEVLTGGASATYGADAVSGVVNFILNTHFEGVKIDANYGLYQHSNHDGFAAGIADAQGDPVTQPGSVDAGFNKDLAVVLGSNFADGKGNATAYVTYTNQAPVLEGRYDYSACTLEGTRTSATTTDVHCGGSYTSRGGAFLGYNAAFSKNTVYDTVDPKTGIFRPFNTATDLFNYGPINYYQRPNERWTAGSFINYDINDHANVYYELMYMKNNSIAQIAPGGDFGNPATINCGPVGVGLPGNPLLTAQERSVICTPANIAAQAAGTPANSVVLNYILRRNVEGGGRQAVFQNESYRNVLGIKGDFAEAWKYDAYAQFNHVTTYQNNLNYFSNSAIDNALDVVEGPTGPTCESVINGTDPACVPYNIWVPGGVTKAALNYLNIPNSITGFSSEYAAHADVSGDLGKYGVQIPTAKSGLQVNFGTEWREDTVQTDPDYATQQGLASGGAGAIPPLSGQIHVAEVFTEFNLPIMDSLPGADQLALEGGYRYSSYNLGFKTNTFKIGLEWAPVSDIRFRGGFNRAVRAPNIGELYSSPSIGPDGTIDPCWGTPVYTLAQCERTGVTAANYGKIGVNSAYQINTSSSGNPNLTPEKANTTSFGFVFQPTFLTGFTASLDYYDIKITNAIVSSTGVATAIISECALTGAAQACGLIHRSADGSLWESSAGFVDTPTSNVGVISTKDVDLKMHYATNIGNMGNLAFNLEGTYVIDNITTPFPGAPSFDCAGLWGPTCGNPLPKWRHVFSTDWATPWSGLDINLRWRYFGSSNVETSSGSPDLSFVTTDYPGFNRISNYSYLDTSAAMEVAKGITVLLGINILLDKDPPTVLSGNCAAGPCNGNTFSQTYDVLGRYIYLHVAAKF